MARFDCTGLAVNCALGSTTETVRREIAAPHSPLRAPPPRLQLPFRTLCGVLPIEPAPLPAVWRAWDNRLNRLVYSLLQPLQSELQRCIARYGAERIGIVLATSTGGMLDTEELFATAEAGTPAATGYDLDKRHCLSCLSDFAQVVTKVSGPSFTISTACSSGTKALASAQRLLEAGTIDAALVGGSDTLCQLTLRGFKGLGILSETACRPFARGREGMNVGEGGALLLLEPASGRGLVRLAGSGESSDAHHMASPAPDGSGAERAMRQALARASVDADALDFINAHGTGTEQNDVAEAIAIERVCGRRTPVVSTKPYTAHTLGAAGAIEAALTILALQDGLLPANLGGELDPAIRIRVESTALRRPFRRALSNSLAFGGSNASVLFEKGDP